MGQKSDYEIGGELGRGKFSTVFHATEKATGNVVALKKVNVFDMMDKKTRDDCIKEVQLLKSLDSPYIVPYLDAWLEDNDLYIALELADYGDLLKLLREHQKAGQFMEERVIWHFFYQISSGLRHMHDCRIIHRDLKPANVFVFSNGRVKLGDLGLGRYLSSKTEAVNSLVGTPYYMAPERLHEDCYDFKSDMWSLGCMLYELAALRSPFYGKDLNLYTLCQKIDKCEFPPLPDIYSEDLQLLVRELIQTDPARRPDINTVHAYAKRMAKKWVQGQQQQQ